MTSVPESTAGLFVGAVAELIPPPRTTEAASAPVPDTALALAAFEDPARVAARVDAWSTRHGYNDPRAAACQWSKYLFRTVVGPFVVAAAGGHAVPARPAGRVTLAEGVPAIWASEWCDPGEPADPAHWAGALLDALAAGCGAPRRVLHGNLANLVDAVLDIAMECGPGTMPRAEELRRRWLSRDASAERSPLQGLILRGDGHRVRRVCCLRYRLGLSYCASCPFKRPGHGRIRPAPDGSGR